MRIAIALLFIAGCSKTTVPECEALVKTAEKIEKCEKIPSDKRAGITRGVEQIRKALKMLEDVGDQAPKEQLEALGRTCGTQEKQIRELYEKVAPECLE